MYICVLIYLLSLFQIVYSFICLFVCLFLTGRSRVPEEDGGRRPHPQSGRRGRRKARDEERHNYDRHAKSE